MTPRATAVTNACLLGPLLLGGAAAQAQTALVKSASVQFITGEGGKESTTALTVTVANAAGKILERVFDSRQEIKPDSVFVLWLQRTGMPTADKVKGSSITFRIEPRGDDHWAVKDARLQVNYEYGPSEIWHWGPFVLETRDSRPFSVDFALTDDHRQ